ncbi:nitroreductase [Streptomyces sp. ISL-86]|uniref:nitroreductase n=1 Tax=Streptomyces sp. ISL-86 TaxID=2819187 RepID=UPI0027E4EB52|nr:nitroreductase [Streptomyces sp. ISL-86]
MSAQPVDTAAAVSLVEDAVTAPSMHNAQPWKFVFREGDGTIELYGDSSRIMPQADPDNRALHLGCAAALFSLRVAAVHAGWQPVVRLLPDAHDPWYLAEIRLGELGSAELDLAAFHPALRRRHTSRFPFTDEEIPAAVQDGLCAEALLEGCRLALPDAWHIDEVLGLVHDSEYREATNPALRAETAGWTRTGAPGPSATRAPRWAMSTWSSASATAPRGRRHPGGRRPRCSASIENRPAVDRGAAWIGTLGSRRVQPSRPRCAGFRV